MRWIKKQLRYIMLGFFLLTNGVIIAEASLSGGPSGTRSSIVSLFLSIFLNKTIPGGDQKEVFVELMTVTDTRDTVINEDMTYFIPLGVTRRLSVELLPLDATDKGVVWTTSNPAVVDVYPGGYLEARGLGENVTVTVTPSNTSQRLSFKVTVHEKLAPPTFSAALLKPTIDVDTTTKLDILLSEAEQREYDPNKLVYKSSNENVARINEYGVIKGINPGTTNISVVGHDKVYPLRVVLPLAPVIKAETIFINAAHTGYVYDKTRLNITFDKENVTDPSVTFISSNSAIATVKADDEGYYIYGSKVAGTATITVYYNSEFLIMAEHTIVMVNVLPSRLDVGASKLEGSVGNSITLTPTLSHSIPLKEDLSVTDQRVTYKSSDTSLATISAGNLNARIVLKKEGKVTITVKSVANPELSAAIELTITPKLLINDNNFTDFQAFVRKTIGHYLLFFMNGFFGFWTFYLFLDEKRRLLMTNIYSLAVGLFSAMLSEIIQYFVPERSGNFLDVLIDFSGYLTATLLLTLLIVLLAYFKKRKEIKNPPVIPTDQDKVA